MEPSRFIQHTWQPPHEANPYTRLAERVRAGRNRLPADLLLPDDVIQSDGEHLTVATARVVDGMSMLTFHDVEYTLTTPRKARVQVLHLHQSRTVTIQLHR